MSILVELAEQADVSVEGVLRVLTREPVSDAVKERVLAVLDDLTPEQTRAVQRFALAALHDSLPRPGERLRAELPAETGGDARPLPAAPSAEVLVELKSVLGDLAEAVRDLKEETGAERRERVDDLAVMIDLITTGWQRLDGRLGRLERQLGRLESAPPAALSLSPPRPDDARGEPGPAPGSEPEPPAVEPGFVDRVRSSRAPLAAAMFVGAALGGIAVMQLLAGDSSAERLASVREATPPATAPGRSGPAATSVVRTAPTPVAPSRPPASTAPGTTSSSSSVLGTTVGQQPKPAPAPAPQTTAARSTTRTTGATTTQAPAAAAPSPGFQPTRNWAWAPVADADYYDVEFLRSGKSFYRASPKQARLTLPDSLVFLPGAYRWVVRPGFGAPAAKKLGTPVVDSPFQVAA